MKRLILLVVLCFHVFVLLAQQDVTTFLGIPVDGTKSEMIEKLKEKGFVYSSHSDNLRGRNPRAGRVPFHKRGGVFRA